MNSVENRNSTHCNPNFLKNRVIEFPDDFPVGILSVRKPGDLEWQKWKSALGTVEVSEELELALSIVRQVRTDLTPLAKLKSFDLQGLDLGWTRISDSDLTNILHLNLLKELDLGWTNITDEGVTLLKNMSELRKLTLTNTTVGTPSLLSIPQFRNLEHLGLRGTSVEDDCLSYIENLPNLRRLDVRNTKISTEGLLRLKNVLPLCEILN